MANEARINGSLQIDTGNLHYRSPITAFVASVTGAIGPTPGAVLATVAGAIVDLSKLTQPGLCQITNQDSSVWVEYGIWDSNTSKFYPLGELGPGESYPIRLSRYLGNEYGSPGTGSVATGIDLMVRSFTSSAWCSIDAFQA